LLTRAVDLQEDMNALKPLASNCVEAAEKIALLDELLEQVVLLGSTAIDETGLDSVDRLLKAQTRTISMLQRRLQPGQSRA
jgi:hypothetical protein